MFETIVVGTDGSETAKAAVGKAVELAKLCGASVHVVTAFRPSAATSMAAVSLEAMTPAAMEVLKEADDAVAKEVDAMLGRIASDLSSEGLAVKTYARAGDAADAIVDVAQEVGADLVVVGNRGMSSAKRFLLGSVSNKVSHHAACSVLIVATTF